jgi:ERI1 exoribonuclease 3
MDDTLHLEKFSHNLVMDLPVNMSARDKVKDQNLDYFLILDLEGKVEILEFPVLMIDAQTMEFIDLFHRYSLLVTRLLEVVIFTPCII